MFLHKERLTLIASIFSLCILLQTSCTTSRTISGEPPVKTLEFSDHWIHVRPLPNAKLSDFVDMRLFGEFFPGITFAEAKAEFGQPNNIRKEQHDTYYEYWTERSRIEIGREESSSGDGVEVSWALYAYPKDPSFYNVLPSTISKHIDANAEKTVVLIKNQSDQTQVLVSILDRRVDHLIWYDR
jgi:hypothetical protein